MTNCYDFPQFWDLAFDDDTSLEADFIQAAALKYCNFPLKRVYEPACGGGRLIRELATRGLKVSGCELSSRAAEYAQRRLSAANLRGTVAVADMVTFVCQPACDVACCLVNSFRHLLTEEDAVRHLQTIAACLRPGGLYIIGLHLLPPDADEEDEEEWAIERDGVSVSMKLIVTSCDRNQRLETIRFTMSVTTNVGVANSGAATTEALSAPQVFTSDYTLRTYEAKHIRELIDRVPEFRLVDVYDFWYDIEDPFELSDELGDTVLVLQKVSRTAEVSDTPPPDPDQL